ncbi:unnamed protein product [Strongylus vulgaris]|uniref:Uncharacterized protein n=1 Tax=Strongylus vulgaris TaxID=40348 RepID=A0A3P7IMI7_STRVU|nr:unnamed protein product [Strongylus vulgaris]
MVTGVRRVPSITGKACYACHFTEKNGFMENGRVDFVLHGEGQSHKLATLFPSIQCCLALMFAAERYADARLRADTENIIGSTFHLQMDLLRSYISMMERVVSDHGMCSTHQNSSSNASKEAEFLAHLPGDQCGSSSLGTPHNDSGFCSGVSSPESCGKKELECSPPKMARIA